jgi:tryptophan-rich sensory protein
MLTRAHRIRSLLGAAVFGGLTALTAAIGGRITEQNRSWYRSLQKPAFVPPEQAFGAVWSVLYTMIAVSGYRVFRGQPGPARRRALALWVLQLALNGAWTPIFFGLRRPRLALADLAALLVAASAYTVAARRVDPKAPLLMAPYLAWIVFGGVLNAEIIRRNPALREGGRVSEGNGLG